MSFYCALILYIQATNILNPYFLHFLNIITEGFIPTYYNLIKKGMQAFAY